MTANYLNDCRQFGKSIGSFQALQHHAAHLYCELEVVKSIVLKALQGLDEYFITTDATCSLARAKASEVARLASQEAVQMHGGIGMTGDYDIGFCTKRIRIAQ